MKPKKAITNLVVLATLSTAFIGCGQDKKVEYSNFPRLEQGYEVVDFNIPTKGKVVRIEKLEDQMYFSNEESDGSLTIAGTFEYEIEPEGRFKPALEHTDNYGRTLSNSNYWIDQREGTVTLKRIEDN